MTIKSEESNIIIQRELRHLLNALETDEYKTAVHTELETICFQIITYVGTARSCYVNAIQAAKAGDFEKAEKMIKQGEEAFVQGHHSHADLIAKDANGELSGVRLILVHAEDQLMRER